MKKGGKTLNKLRPPWGQGIFVGVWRKSNQAMVTTKSGLVLSRSLRRLPSETRWGPDCVCWSDHAPWRLYKGHEGADGGLPEGVPSAERPKTEKVPRVFGIIFRRTKYHNLITGCAGVWSRWNVLAFQPHSAACRARFREIITDDASGQCG